MSNFIIRAANITDGLKLQKIGKQTFLETFNSNDSAIDIEQYLNEKFSLEQLNSELKNPKSKFFFSEINNKIIGYLKINTGDAQTENLLSEALEIERIYVISKYQGKNIGKLLFDKAICVAKQKKIKDIWLGVWKKNHSAIKFYKKNGFVKFDKHKFTFGQDESINILMKLKVN